MKKLTNFITKSAKLYLFISILFYGSSCQKETDLVPNQIFDLESDYRTSFAELLSLAISNDPRLSVFLKNESLKQFDNDYDILISKSINEIAYENFSFYEILKKYDEMDILDNILAQDPLLTIFIPDLPSFSAKTWDPLHDDTPLVALEKNRNSKIIKYYSVDGVFEMPIDHLPSFPVMVLKTNERIRLDEQLIKSSLNGGFIENSLDLPLEFISNDFNRSLKEEFKSTSSARIVSPSRIDQKIIDAYEKAEDADCVCPHRDYIYYDIFTPEGKAEGAFDSRYNEAITDIEFASVAAIERATDGWTEGNLELLIETFFIGGSSSVSSLSKVYNIPVSEVQDIETETTCFQSIIGFRYCWDVIVGRETKSYELPDPAELVTWRMDEFGDKIRYKVSETDTDVTTVETVTHETTKAGNFKFDVNLGTKVKVGAGFGGSSTTTVTSSIQKTYSQGSDQLGEGVIDWTDPVISTSLVFSYPGPFILPRVAGYLFYTTSTGSVILTCATVRK